MNKEDKALLDAALELLEYIDLDSLIQFVEDADEIFICRCETLEDDEEENETD